MKLDELKEIWKNETIEETTFFKEKINKIESYQSAFEKVKRLIKLEFYTTWIFIGIFIVALLKMNLNDYEVVVRLFLVVAIFFTCYYHIIFYRFYKNHLSKGINTFHALIEFTTEYKYGLHIYRSYNYIIALLLSPIVFAILTRNNFKLLLFILEPLHFVIIVFGYLILVTILQEIWIYCSYSKNYKEMKTVLSQLQEID